MSVNFKEIPFPDALVGAIALEYVLLKFQTHTDEGDFRGAFHVLSGFSPEQLVGFIQAKQLVGARASHLKLQFPKSAVAGYDVDQSYLTSASAVGVRNQPRENGSVTLTAEVDEDAEASLADSDRTDASDLKDKNIARIWVEFVAKKVGRTLLPDELRNVEALLNGLFGTGRCPTAKVAEYLQAVLTGFENEPLRRAAGRALPIIGLPRFDDCFSSLNDVKIGQASQWTEKFKTHYGLECYLDKRGISQELLDAETLQNTLARLRSDDQQPPIPSEILNAFEHYIASDGHRNAATENLLFNFDWSYSRHCFEKTRGTSSKDFSARTLKALQGEAISPTADDNLVIDVLKNLPRKSGKAPVEFREFFEKYSEALEKDARLFIEWEDYVHGKKVECTDLYQGIFECIQRAARDLSPHEPAYLEIEGKAQIKPNRFFDRSRQACQYFERAYRSLESMTKRRIRFKNTKIFSYTSDILPHLEDDRKRFSKAKKTSGANSLEFKASVFKELADGTSQLIISLSLTWKFPFSSVLQQETSDFDALYRYHAKKKTTLVQCYAEYDSVGRKGIPLPLSLDNTDGFADVVRAGGRGAFVPAQDRIKSITVQWDKLVEEGESLGWFLPEEAPVLKANFSAFEEIYNAGILALRNDAMDHRGTTEIVAAYRALLLKINDVSHESARRQLLRTVMSIGLAQIPRSGRRAPTAIICPWHPLRLESIASRQQQVLHLIGQLLGSNRPPFSDGINGSLFFGEVEQLLCHPPYPEIALVWEQTDPSARIVTQALGGYTLHQGPRHSDDSDMSTVDNGSALASLAIEREINEYLRLQPHERDNLSVLLYNCDVPELPIAVVKSVNRINEDREGDKITCQVMLMHRDERHLRQIYRDLVARGIDGDVDSTEATGDFLAKVRVNITAANRLRRQGRVQPVDIAYCRDVISNEAKIVWEWVQRETVAPILLQPHQWSRRLPVAVGDRRVRLQLVCPAQTEAGWAYLYSIAKLCGNGAKDAWDNNKCPVLMKNLDFDDKNVERIFRETHELATWVVNQDELLDRKLLEACNVKVIRYIQSSTHGRNLIISSDARDTLLVNTLKERLRSILLSGTEESEIERLAKRFMEDANRISGGLVLRAARRANNSNELLGMVLSRYLVQAELGGKRNVAWCFLDDYSQWLGKKEGANIADLLILAPMTNEDGTLHLDVMVTEAKFVAYDALGAATNQSEKQLVDTLSQIAEALDVNTEAIDRDIWLARLSDLLVLQTATTMGKPAIDAAAWRRAIRERTCTFRIWGYSHVFVYSPQDFSVSVRQAKGIQSNKVKGDLEALQEIFSPVDVRNLLTQYLSENHEDTNQLRIDIGHPSFGLAKIRTLPTKREDSTKQDQDLRKDTDPSRSRESITVVQPSKPRLLPIEVAEGKGSTQEDAEKDNELLRFLEIKSSQFETSAAEGLAWLDATTIQVRNALISRGLTAKLCDGFSPILTPNAGIIKLQGSKDLTVQAVESRASEIFTSDGLQIINVTPESGRISIAIKRPVREILHTERVLLEFLRISSSLPDNEKIFVGIAEEDGSQILLDPFSQPHTLVAGITGSGKSILIQNILLTIAASRSPDEARIYLIDPKFGLDYRPLEDLPHLVAGSGKIVDEPEAAIEILKGLVVEMDSRYRLFKEFGVPNISAYRRVTGKIMPTLWVIHDEFTDWMMIDEYRKAVPEVVNRISVKARAAGIFLIFAAQRPDKDAMPMQLRSQLGNRLILKVDNEATSEIALGIKNGGAERLLGRGHMLARTDQATSVFAQVPYIDIETTVPEIVAIIRRQYKDFPATLP